MSQTQDSIEYSEVIPTKPGYYVYRCWAADCTCLYVGLCGERGPRQPYYRFSCHKSRKPWWPQVARIDIATFNSAAEIIEEERKQIIALRPVHNVYLQPTCINGHNVGRYKNGTCIECERIRHRVDRRKAKVKERDAASKRRRRYRMNGLGPAPGQEGLW